MNDEPIKCPKCYSAQIHVDKRGFKAGRAIAGGLITGNILAAAASGGVGMNNIELTCLKCGHKFKPGEGGQMAQQNAPSRQEVREFESHVIKPGESEKTQMYRCDCGKESCIPVNSPICPKCGRRLNENHKFVPTHKSGCASIILLLILASAFALFL